MTETEVAAVHGDRDRGHGEPARAATAASSDGRRDRRVRDDRRRAVQRGGRRACSRSTPAGYLLCGDGAADCSGHLALAARDREPHLLETVRPGVFAAGDVRAGASNRVAGAVGDGALAVRFVHDVLSA